MTHDRITIHNIKPGMVIMRLGGEYPEAALQVSQWNDGTVTIAPLGGGFVYKMSLLERYEMYEVTEEQKKVPWRQDWVGIDEPPFFRGWHKRDSWNGWRMPYFEKAEADLVAAYFQDDEGRPGWYDAERDCYCWHTEYGPEDGCPDHIERWGAEEIEVSPGRKIKVYGIGTGCWTWSVTWPDARGLMEMFDKVNADCAADPSLGNVVPYTDTSYYAEQIMNMHEASGKEMFWDTFDDDDAERMAEDLVQRAYHGERVEVRK